MALQRKCWRGLHLFAIGLMWVPAFLAGAGQPSATTHTAANAEVSQWIHDGQDLASQGRFAEAEIPLKQATAVDPKNYPLLTLLGKVEGRLGKHDDAIALLRRVTAGQPKSADAHVNLAIALADAGKLEDALTETSAAVAISPK